MIRKLPAADLHRKSPRIFAVSLLIAAGFTAFLLTRGFPVLSKSARTVTAPPVIIHLQNIPQTRQVIRTPAPPKPFIPEARPVATDAPLPENATIADTKLEIETVPEAPPAILIPAPHAGVTEEEVFEFFTVEEPPKRKTAIPPEYPEMARRAGIEGTVYLKVLVNARGTVDSVEVQSGPAIFHKPAEAAARATAFTPALQNDRPVACWVMMPFRFVISRE